MFFFLSKILDLFLSPLTWGLLLLAASVPWRPRAAKRWRRRRVFGVAGLAIMLLSSSGCVSNALEWHLEESAVRTYKDDATYDAVIVLGGVGDERIWKRRGAPSFNDNVERIIVAESLLRENKARVAIVSGGVNDPGFQAWNEARQLGDQLRAWGVSGDRIIVEDRARNTRENAVYSAEIVRRLGLTRVLVVTSAFHVPRAADCFRAVGLDVDFLPVDYRAHPPEATFGDAFPRAAALFMTTSVVREVFGRWVYRARGYGEG